MQDDNSTGTLSNIASRGDDDTTSQITPASRIADEARQISQFGVRKKINVTDDFTAAAKLLLPDQLVKDEYFTLFEAVGALEITDPKMDSGFVPRGDTFDPEFDPCASLEATEILWIMDQLLCLEITWHDGYPLSQTIFTSLHVDRLISPDNKPPYRFSFAPEGVQQPSIDMFLLHTVLRAYCIGLIKSCQMVLYRIKSQTFFEEEDFVTHLFGRDLLPSVGSRTAIGFLATAEELLEDRGLPEDIRAALSKRLEFRRQYLAATEFDSEVPTDRHWETLLPQLMKTISETHKLGKQVPSAFSEKVQRKLASSTPPRPMINVCWEDAVEKWQRLFNDMFATVKLTRLDIWQDPHCVQRATWAFAYRDPQPGTFARARVQDILFEEQNVNGGAAYYEQMLSDIRALALSGDTLAETESFQVEAPADPRHMRSRVVEDFFTKALDEYLNLYRMVCQNRCRIRRTFTQTVGILDALESEALRFDQRLNDIQPQPPCRKSSSGRDVYLNPLSSWTRFHKLRIMAWVVQLGFETDIYLPDELGGMYWFLSRLCAERGNLLDHINGFLFDRMRSLTTNGDHTAIAECLSSQDWIESLLALCDATRLIAQALWRLYTLLEATKIVIAPKRDFILDPTLLYEARMKPFLSVVNERIPRAEDFARSKTFDSTLEMACAAIESDVKQAKSFLAELKKTTPEQGKYVGTEEEWAREIKQMETSCVATAVSSSQLKRIAVKNGMAEAREGTDLGAVVELEIPPPGKKRYHDWWVVPVLREKK